MIYKKITSFQIFNILQFFYVFMFFYLICLHDFSWFVYPLTCFSSYLLFPSSLSCCVVYMISSYLSILGHVFLNWVCTVRGLSFRGLYCQWLVFPGFVLSEDCLSEVFFRGLYCQRIVFPEFSFRGLNCQWLGFPGFVMPWVWSYLTFWGLYFQRFCLSGVCTVRGLSFRGLNCERIVFPELIIKPLNVF